MGKRFGLQLIRELVVTTVISLSLTPLKTDYLQIILEPSLKIAKGGCGSVQSWELINLIPTNQGWQVKNLLLTLQKTV